MRNNKGRFKKGEHASPKTEFKKGQHWRKPRPYWDRDWLYQAYVTEQKSAAQIAGEQGCRGNNILYFLKKHGIPTRTMKETRGLKHWGASGPDNPMYGVTGPDNPNWRGGCTPERQACYSSPEWARAVKTVWQRDVAICQRCGTKPTEDKRFHIHHIVSFAVRDLRTEPSNLVLLCADCHHWVHSKTNTQRGFIKGGDEE